MMNFLLNDNLDDQYEEWNASIYMENNFPCDKIPLNNECIDESPNLEFDMHQEQMSLPMIYTKEFIESGPDSLDDIDPDSLFYQKSFAELTPVKCEYNASSTPMNPQTVVQRDLNMNFEVTDNLNLIDSACLTGPEVTNISQNNIYELLIPNKIYSLNYSPNIEQHGVASNDFTMIDSCPDYEINIQDDFEFRLLQNSPPIPPTSDYIKFEIPVYEGENDSFETESNVSSTDSYTSTQENCHQESAKEIGESSWVKEIKVGKNNRPRGPKCWEFLLRLLRDNASNPSLVKWENSDLGSFKLVEKDKISAIWGNRPSKKKNGKIIKYESFARILRYHYKKGSGMVLPVSEKHLVYKFASEVMAAYRSGKIL